ncbi:hypothetical protein [Acuticoccus sediminis]|uniref:hypothetical protein n=1 Tax=Acuticoccus sediminis TaxID=2184697 RepID=UPI001CFDD711|nr:hypothetical protein [Acuticoccus sediminis]
MADFSSPDASEWVVTTAEAAALFDCSARWVQKRARAGYFSPVARGCFRLADVVRGFTRAADEAEARARGSDADDRLRHARAREVEARTARLDARSVDVDEVTAFAAAAAEIMLSEYAGLPARIGCDPSEIAKIEAIFGQRRDRLAARMSGVIAQLRDVDATPTA